MTAHDPNTYKKLKHSKEVQKQYYNWLVSKISSTPRNKWSRTHSPRQSVKANNNLEELGKSYLVWDAENQTIYGRNRCQLRTTGIRTLPPPDSSNTGTVVTNDPTTSSKPVAISERSREAIRQPLHPVDLLHQKLKVLDHGAVDNNWADLKTLCYTNHSHIQTITQNNLNVFEVYL